MVLVNPQNHLGKLSFISKNRWIDAGFPALDIVTSKRKNVLG